MAETIFVQRKLNHLVAAMPADLHVLEGLAAQRTYRAVLTRATGRSVVQNNLYWGGLIPAMREASQQPLTEKGADHLLKIRTGHCKPIALADGTVVLIPDSISFANMDQDAFNSFFNFAQMVAARDFGISLSDLQRETQERAA